ncbi:MAG: hypothetical protein LBH75_03525 [Treponema sp.]|jgi:hypothetical protein|nr:hypothetical protein [Treponema sp.]
MIRLEIIANHSVEENILEEFHNMSVGAFYTKIPGVLGVGTSGPRMGDAVWPEENFVLVIWCEKSEAAIIEQAVANVKEKFPDEGIKVFKLNDAPSQQVYLPPPPPIQTPQVQAPKAAPATEQPATVDPFAPTSSLATPPPPAVHAEKNQEKKPLGMESENS